MDRDKAIRAAKLTANRISNESDSLETSTQDASHIFGNGAVYKFYKHPKSGGYIQILQRPSGPASVIGLEVPEEFRGQGIGQRLQAEAMKNHPSLMGQVSSKAAATTAYRLGRRPYGNPEATLDDVFKGIDSDSSVNMLTPDAQPKSKGGALELARHATAVGRAGGQVAPSKYLPDVPRAVHADGGRVGYGNGGKSLGLYSKAAQVIRNQPQAKGSVDQLLAMVSKTKGVKPAELSNAGRPAGKTMSKEELAQHFEQALPDVQVMRKGREVQTALNALMQQDRRNWTQEDWDKANALHFEAQKQPSTRYDQYTLSGGENYREHLLHLPRQDGPIAKRLKALQGQWQEAYENQAPREDLDRMGAKIDALSEDAENEDVNFKSDHWQTPNVLAHVRMSDRDNGKTLHVHEVQSDWGQAGREQGFHDPENPYEVINKKTREVVSKHPDFSSMWDAYRTNPNSDSLDYGDYSTEKPPQGPYVGNTQQWTDLALKHVLMEAAKGGHDRVVFSPGEANADMYGQRKEMGMLKFLKSKDSGEAGVIVGYSKDGRRLSPHKVDSHAEVEKLIGKENATNLLAQPQMPAPEKSDDSYIDTLQSPLQQGDSRYTHTLQGPLTVGGHGMIDYYKNFAHQGALKLLQQHDPSIKPESYDLPNDYKGFALPMTDTARESILKNGFQAFKRGGEVHKADGGEVEKKRDFMRDNPGGEWLEGKQTRAAQYPGDKFMIGATTGVIGGRSSVFLPTHVLKGIAGLNDEVRTTGVSKYDSLMSDAQKGGFDPEQKGNKVVVAVNHFGQPYLLEGNTRVAVAHSMGIPKVKAEVRYWNGAENVDGPMHPENVFSMASDSPDVAKATGGPVMGYVPMASLTVPRLAVARAPQYQQQAPAARFSESLNSLMDTVEGFKKKPDAPVESPSAASEGHAPQGMSEAAAAAYGKLTDAWGQPLTVVSAYRDPEKNQEVGGAKGSQHLHGNAYDIDTSGLSYEDRLRLADEAWNAGFRGVGFYDNNMHFDVGDPRAWGPSYSRDSIPEWAQDWANTRYRYATGGRTLDKSGLYSKALEVARNIQQQRGTPAQFMAQLKNSKGVKPAEIEAIGMPAGDKITRDEFVQHIASKVPKLSIAQYGENPNYLHHGEQKFLRDTWIKEDLSPEDREIIKNLRNRRDARPFPERNALGDEIDPGYEEYSTSGGENYRERLIKLGGDNQYQSSHWNDVPNVLAHIRMKDRDAPNGDRLLHVEEIQSDWGQDGRKKGFHDPQNPYEVIHRGTGQVVSKHPSFDSMMESTQGGPNYQDFDYVNASTRKIPAAPYVQNTQHWTDLAMKHIMREAALGDYDGVIFTPGQIHADRYGHEDASGMEGYYDNIVPKSALSTVQQHDPSIKPQTMNVNGEYDAWHIPLTSTAKDSILKNGFPMFKRGGTVDGKAEGGSAMNEDNQNGAMENGNAPINSATRPQAGELPNAGGVRGGAGLLQAQNEAPLEGLPQKIIIPLTGQVIQAGADPRIRQVARDYMAQAGLSYSPPTKYARVDPKRAARIASDYTDMEDNPDDPLTKASYNAMIKETMDQYHAAKKSGLKIEFWNPRKQEDPYKASPRLATEDIRNNHHMWVFPTYSGYGSGEPISEDDAKKNPLLQLTGETWNGIPVTVNDVFRAIHDYYGHAKEGLGFRADGEENAWRAHASMFSPLARMAMTSETRGQNSWLNYGPHGEHNRKARTEDTIFAPQKIGVMSHLSHHEGAEDFITPEDISFMASIRSRFGKKLGGAVEKALALTRRFTKDGKSAIDALKPKGK